MRRPYVTGTPEERIAAGIVRDGEHWLWQGYMHLGKHPAFSINGEKVYVRRWLIRQQIGHGQTVLPRCKIDRCVSPACAEVVSHREMLVRANTPVMQNARKTHCKHGHELTDDNIYRVRYSPRARPCKQCARDKARRAYEKRANA